MRKLSILALASLFVAAGCEGCAFPFETTSTGTIRLSLKPVGPDCTGGGEDDDDNGTPDDTSDDSHVTWEHLPASNQCHLTSTWTGVLVQMADVRTAVNKSVSDAGFDPATVQVEITSITPTVDSVTLVDDISGSADPDVTAALAEVVASYRGCVNSDDSVCVGDQYDSGMVTVTSEGGSVQSPVTVVNDSTALSDAANEAINDGTNVAGVGLAELVVDMTSDGAPEPTFTVPASVTALENPTLLITLTFTVNGDAIVGGSSDSDSE